MGRASASPSRLSGQLKIPTPSGRQKKSVTSREKLPNHAGEHGVFHRPYGWQRSNLAPTSGHPPAGLEGRISHHHHPVGGGPLLQASRPGGASRARPHLISRFLRKRVPACGRGRGTLVVLNRTQSRCQGRLLEVGDCHAWPELACPEFIERVEWVVGLPATTEISSACPLPAVVTQVPDSAKHHVFAYVQLDGTKTPPCASLLITATNQQVVSRKNKALLPVGLGAENPARQQNSKDP